jgi:aryl-alcohol dehydrogenase-like predicted oxidoreductase
MIYRNLGITDTKVSVICLGSMTWGEQNTEAEGHQQMDYAIARGINFIDTAEMYSVPGRKETQGSTERIIGSWFKNSGKRKEIVLATKVTGPMPAFEYLTKNRGFTKDRINEALEGSFQRLQTDYVDLYQLHWPERKMNFFGVRGYSSHDDVWEDKMAETVQTMKELISAGKIRYWGLSNESPWGVMRFRDLCKELGCPMPVSIQNPYNLLNRTFEVGLSEIAVRESIGLLAYSPLGFGRLSGKYEIGQDDDNSRINKFPRLARYNGAASIAATKEYLRIARENNLTLSQMALAYVNDRFFVTSNIIGATNMTQLKENIDSVDIHLSPEIMSAIDQVYNEYPDPAP